MGEGPGTSPGPFDSARGGRARTAARSTIRGRMTPQLEATLAKLPTRPGVYLMKDARGEVLYVGKAQNLRNRVRSYWQKEDTPGLGQHLIRAVIDRIVDVE